MAEAKYAKSFTKYLTSVARKLGHRTLPAEFTECNEFVSSAKAKSLMYATRFTPVQDGAAFPSNPLFRPQPPVSQQTRRAIYEAYTADPSLNTPLKLAEDFGISVERVKAIVRLRALAHTFTAPPRGEGKRALQTELTKAMESFLGNVSPNAKARIEPVHVISTKSDLPLYQLVDEHEAAGFTPVDAAHILEKVPFQNILTRLNRGASAKFSAPERDVHNIDVDNQAEKSTGKRGFLISDTSNVARPKVMVRLNGERKLREETPQETLQRIKNSPAYRA